MSKSMAASPGLVGHEAYYAYTPAASLGFPPDGLVVASNCAEMMDFLPPAAAVAGDAYFPELCVHPSPDYYSPPPVFVSKNEMNMRFVDDGRRRMMSRAAGGNGHRPSWSRIGFRTRTEVDVLDDGFKWRKYGKKAVKSSPNPRNYYRCSAEGCGVKKRIEREHHDPRYVVTTYDGIHNHVAPPLGCAGAGAAGHHTAAQQAALCAAATLATAPSSDMWGVELRHAAAMAQSSESSY